MEDKKKRKIVVVKGKVKRMKKSIWIGKEVEEIERKWILV